MTEIDRPCVKGLVREWVGDGMVASSVRNNLDPLRVMIHEAIEDGQMTVDPMAGVCAFRRAHGIGYGIGYGIGCKPRI